MRVYTVTYLAAAFGENSCFPFSNSNTGNLGWPKKEMIFSGINHKNYTLMHTFCNSVGKTLNILPHITYLTIHYHIT